MAASDLAGYKQDIRTTDTAYDVLNNLNVGPLANDVANDAAAAAAGVKDVAHIDYVQALQAYEARPDIEDLARRRARDFPATFGDAAFMRQVNYGTGSSAAI